jgi:hypothetical protein
MGAFDYPQIVHQRRHGPSYKSLASYRAWLRDEFSFRCVYCLFREQWGRVKGEFDVEHWQAQVNDPQLGLDYDNLFYGCHTCNLLKGTDPVPDPGHCLTADQVRLNPDGSIEGLSDDASELIEILGLDSDSYREWRQVWIRNVELAEQYDPQQYRRLMGFPEDLPDLSAKLPAENKRPEGVQESWFARRQRGELPETY